MNKSRIFAAALCAVVATTTAACSSSPEEQPAEPAPLAPPAPPAPAASAPQARLDGIYRSSSLDGTYTVFEFVDATRYRAWRRDGGACASLAPGETPPADCAETGTYALTHDKLTMTDERTGKKTSFGYRVTSFDDDAADGSAIKTSSLTPRDLANGSGNQLIDGQSTLLVATNVELIDENGKKDDVKQSPWKGRICRAACWGLAGLGVAAVGVACTGVSVITIGGTAIPCTVAILAVAAGAGAGASICSDAICPP